MTEIKDEIRLKIEEGDKIEKGDLVTVDNTEGFIEKLIYEVFEISIQDKSGKVSKSTIIQNELGSEVQFEINDQRVHKVQSGF
ncbi:MAG: hypothetical protein KAQ64_02070 [Candidatus Pacebacteria bacterium]|nr:hypothetical protein [Candidatus Paceibacterota bacterium]